jgi:hypothetical protein
VVRPSDEEVEQQNHEHADQPTSEDDDTLVESAQLLLSVDGALLQVQGLLRDPTVLCEMLALSIAYLFQQPVSLVLSFHYLIHVPPRFYASRERATTHPEPGRLLA